MQEQQQQQARAWLVLRLRELAQGIETQLETLETEGHHLADLEEMASDVNVDGVIFEQFRTSSDTAHQIEKALSRLDEGLYEVCEDCEGDIGTERIEALPFATQCVECKRQAELTV